MPLYDCVLLLKPHVKEEAVVDLVSRVGKHIFKRNGIVTEVKSFGTVQLGYGIKKIDGRYYQGKLMQMSMMATPNINKELHYLNQEDRLLRWLLVKQRNTRFGQEYNNDNTGSFFDSTQHGLDDLEDGDDDNLGYGGLKNEFKGDQNFP